MNLKIAYISLTLFIIIILIIIGIKAINLSFTDKSIANKKKGILIGGLIFWQVYVYIIANSGVLDNFDFPPRFALFLIVPLFIFTGIFIYRNRNNNWISNIPEHWLMFYQSFRILIESIFVLSVAQGILNKEVTIEGYNYDMIFGYTALIMGYLAYKKLVPKKVFIIWNYLGLAVIASIIFLFLASIFNPQLFGSETMILPEASVKYPYVLVAGFLMPSAVFIHVLSIVQLRKKH
jgi:hypothetical protein